MSPSTRQAERSEATRSAIIEVAQRLFAERGYAAVSTEEIVASARVTRGALYHHFRDKRDLFRAVHERLEQRLVETLAAKLERIDDPWKLITTGVGAYLDACLDPALARIALIDAPSVLGWSEWREIDLRYSMGLVTAGLQGGMDAGVLRRQEVRPLAHLMVGALGEAGLLIANAERPREARKEVGRAVLAILEGLRAPGG